MYINDFTIFISSLTLKQSLIFEIYGSSNRKHSSEEDKRRY